MMEEEEEDHETFFDLSSLHKPALLQDAKTRDEWSLFASIILGLGLDEGADHRVLMRKAKTLFGEESPQPAADATESLNQCQEAVRRQGRTFEFGVHLILDEPGGPEIFAVALQADDSYKARHLIPLFRVKTTSRYGWRYFLVRDVSKFLMRTEQKGAAQVCHRRRLCFRCLAPFVSLQALMAHQQSCSIKTLDILHGVPEYQPVRLLPVRRNANEPPTVVFKQWDKMEAEPVTVVADFESALVPSESQCVKCANEMTLKGGRCRCNRESVDSFTRQVQRHKALAYCIVVIDKEGTLLHVKTEICKELRADRLFINELLRIEPWLQALGHPKAKISVSYQQAVNHPMQGQCRICLQKLTHYDLFMGSQHTLPDGYQRLVADHDHTRTKGGNYRGVSHFDCNIKLREPRDISVVSFFFLGPASDESPMTALPFFLNR